MPPLRSVALMASVVALFCLLSYQFAYYDPQALAQSDPNVAEPGDVTIVDDTLAFDLEAINDSPKAVGAIVTFRAVVTNGNANGFTFSWNFGDGDTDVGQVAQHRYLRTGVFKAVVFASNGTESKRAETTVYIIPPTATPTPPPDIRDLKVFSDQPTVAGNPTGFFATIASGLDVTFVWDFGDNSPPAQGIAVSHIYQIPGRYTAKVTASNAFNTAEATTIVTIEDAPPRSVELFMPASTAVNTWTTFSASVASGTNVIFEWVMSDGTVWVDPVVGPLRRTSTYIHRFDRAQPHTVTVYARNSKGVVSTAKEILVRDRPPILLNILPSLTGQGETTAFIGYVVSESRVKATWYWGDKTARVIDSPQDQDSINTKEIEGAHTYPPGAGRYYMQVLFQNTGGWVVGDQIVRVNVPPLQQNTTISYTPAIARVGEPVTFALGATLANPNCTWYFGHNTSPLNNAQTRVDYPYQEAGFYVVHVRCLERNNSSSPVFEAERLIYVSGNFFMPAVALGGDFAPLLPEGVGPGAIATPTLLPTPLPPTSTSLPTATITPVPLDTQTPTPTQQPTATATSTATPTPTATATIDLGGTIPQVTPTATATLDPGGTIPQP